MEGWCSKSLPTVAATRRCMHFPRVAPKAIDRTLDWLWGPMAASTEPRAVEVPRGRVPSIVFNFRLDLNRARARSRPPAASDKARLPEMF
jgi:hypothetical protein